MVVDECDKGEGSAFTFVFTGGGRLHRRCGEGFYSVEVPFSPVGGAGGGEDRAGRMKAG